MNRPVAVVTGVGPGTGSAIVRRLAAGGYAVAMLARNRERLVSLERDVQYAKAYACDVSDEAQIDASIAALQRDMGSPSVLVHNAVGGAWGTFQDIDPKILNRNFQINTMALLHLARRLAPAMVERGSGAIVVTGNTSALRGRANFAGFAATKAAQRILAEAMARELGPKGVHVAYIVIDAVIDLVCRSTAAIPTKRPASTVSSMPVWSSGVTRNPISSPCAATTCRSTFTPAQPRPLPSMWPALTRRCIPTDDTW